MSQATKPTETKHLISVKKYEAQGTRLLAACDEELLGRSFSEGKIHIDVKREFYGGELVGGEKLEEMMKNSDVMNLVGERAVAVAKKLGYASEKCILKVEKVPHLQIVVFR